MSKFEGIDHIIINFTHQVLTLPYPKSYPCIILNSDRFERIKNTFFLSIM